MWARTGFDGGSKEFLARPGCSDGLVKTRTSSNANDNVVSLADFRAARKASVAKAA
jgi:hypothetical protein